MTRLRLLSLPADHRYVRHAVGSPGETGSVLLPDPPVPGAAQGVWWPSPAWEPAWVQEHRGEFDLVHVHFGFEHRTPEQVLEWTRTLRRWGIPLAVTVHDLDLPHTRDQQDHRRRLAHLVGAADEVLTLTEGAATAVRELTGRTPAVLPHPRMEPLEVIRAVVRPPVPTGPVTVGVHLKSLRANAGRVELLEGLGAAAAELGPGRAQLEVTLHREVADPSSDHHDASIVRWAARQEDRPGVDVRWIDPLDDAGFTAYLSALGVSVLPHRWGTHSGWVEQCLDLGTVPVVPDVGHLEEQGARHVYRWRGDRPDHRSLVTALGAAVEEARQGRGEAAAAAWADHRARQDEVNRTAHARAHHRALAAHQHKEAS
ncbi:hypothetical protein [Kytococcus sedentarius]|uniref:hypothetical protein n=1 Tax=Kytococcus sedentarius TaxID=1276 RepID=UPI0035BBD2AC